jgi:hypothetical protein
MPGMVSGSSSNADKGKGRRKKEEGRRKKAQGRTKNEA